MSSWRRISLPLSISLVYCSTEVSVALESLGYLDLTSPRYIIKFIIIIIIMVREKYGS